MLPRSGRTDGRPGECSDLPSGMCRNGELAVVLTTPAGIGSDLPEMARALGLSASLPVRRPGSGAAEWRLEGLPPGFDLRRARNVAGEASADLNLVPVQGRRKKLLVADMDMTVTTCESIDELADSAGLRAEISAVTDRAMRGELDFRQALAARVSLLAGLRTGDLERTDRERIVLTRGARTLVRTMRASGSRTVLVSGGFAFFVARVAARAGFDEYHGNHPVMRDDVLTGEIPATIIDAREKRRILLCAAARAGLLPAECLAVGDGANDLPMIQAAGLGVSYRGKPVLEAQADASLRFCDLSALLYLQGYEERCFCAGQAGGSGDGGFPGESALR